ncbi:hypothetical protein Pint_24710 [Pistacia integerrima]|uniref:Uncharacterized protein n=1 Tax=Pistacia integerrima TaxID=434235 RepID=A0ACC0YF75_9ROSI|nr:hypothetical protein Pint_24710 [Pistacia integerrima]
MARGELFNVFENEEVIKNINNWFNERGSLPFIGNFRSFSLLLDKFGHIISLGALDRISGNYILCKQSELLRYVRISSNVNKFQSAISNGCLIDDAFEWVMNSKEAFCELEHIDPDFKSINFTKEEWDDATLLYNSWKVLKDLRDDLWNSLEPKQTANVYFPMVYHIFFKLLQLGKSENLYYCQVASQFLSYFDQCWGNSNLILVIVVILDPQFKMNIVEHFYEEIYGNQVDTPFKKIIDGVRNIYNKYAEGTNNSKSSSSSYHVDNSNCPSSEGFNLLEWWRVNSTTYPTLAKITRDFLSIPFYPMFDLDYSLSHEIDDIYDCCYLDDDLKQVFTCTKVWLNCPVIK